MQKNEIIFIVNGTRYTLSASDVSAINRIAEPDRAALIALLEAIRAHEGHSTKTIDAALAPEPVKIAPQSNTQIPKAERLGRGDVDALMAKLAMEEKRNQKPGLTKRGIYTSVGIFAVVVFMLVIIFWKTEKIASATLNPIANFKGDIKNINA